MFLCRSYDSGFTFVDSFLGFLSLMAKSSKRRQAFQQAVKQYMNQYKVSKEEAKLYMEEARRKLEAPQKKGIINGDYADKAIETETNVSEEPQG